MTNEKDLTAVDRRKQARTGGRLEGWLDRQGWMDPVSDFIQKVVGGFYGALGRPGRTLKDLMHGVWPLGHPLHPALTDIPLGAWTVAVVADYVSHWWTGLPRMVGDAALAVGLAGALAAAAAGYTDFHETSGQERRTGLLHGLTMTMAVLVMAVSLGLRIWLPSARPTAVGLASGGYVLALFGAYVGGHLSFKFGTMVNRHAFTQFLADWFAVGASQDFPEGQMKLVHAGDNPVLLVRRSGVLQAISNTCSHAGGPLSEGQLDGDIVTCPWHGSRFCITDGSVKGGPATFVQPTFIVDEGPDEVRVRSAVPSH